MQVLDDKRRASRHRVLKEGKIVMHNNLSVVDCSIRDLSDSGARIRCKDQPAVPTDFKLLLTADLRIRDAHVVWRKDDQLGLQFTGEWKPAPPRKW
jgi:hypothetical protein